MLDLGKVQYNSIHKKELRTDDLEEKYGKDTVFINEDLTKTRVGWAKRAGVLKKLKKTSETWTRDGDNIH